MSNSFNLSVAPEIAAVSALVSTVDTVVDAIKLKTDVTPQKVRGNFKKYYYSAYTAAFGNVCNITGQGKLLSCIFWLPVPGDDIELKITIDGVVSSVLSHTGDSVTQIVFISDNTALSVSFTLVKIPYSTTIRFPIDIEFDTSLQIETRSPSTSGSGVQCCVAVSEDTF